MKYTRGLDMLLAMGILGGVFIWVASANDKSKTADRKASVAKRVADAIATRDPQLMRELADELQKEGLRDQAESLRMAADIADELQSRPVP